MSLDSSSVHPNEWFCLWGIWGSYFIERWDSSFNGRNLIMDLVNGLLFEATEGKWLRLQKWLITMVSGFLNSLLDLSVMVWQTFWSDNTMAFTVALNFTVIQVYIICKQMCSQFPFKPLVRVHQTVHLFVWDHNLALILLMLPLNKRLSGCRSRADADELAVPCQVPPEVFSPPQTDLPKSEGIALEMFSLARCSCRCLVCTLPCYLWCFTHCFFDGVELGFRDAFQI